MKEVFKDWTAYDDWLMANYNNYAITSLNEVTLPDGTTQVEAEYINKEEWTQQQKQS